MILSSEAIGHLLASEELILRPYSDDSQQPASYDLRSAEDIILKAGACTLVHTLEWVELPLYLAAKLMCRSSFGRRGVLIGGGYVDPGFRGNLTLCLVNMGEEDVTLQKGERVVQMIFHQVTGTTEGYEGRYQDSAGAVAVRF
jgi:dCTP deaminase